MVRSVWAGSGPCKAQAPSLVARRWESERTDSARSLLLVCSNALVSGGGSGGGGGGIITSCLTGGVGSGAEGWGGTLDGRCGGRRFPGST